MKFSYDINVSIMEDMKLGDVRLLSKKLYNSHWCIDGLIAKILGIDEIIMTMGETKLVKGNKIIYYINEGDYFLQALRYLTEIEPKYKNRLEDYDV